MKNKKLLNRTFLLSILFVFLVQCSTQDQRKTPGNAQERARKNIEEGKGVSVGGLLKGRRSTNYEFSSSNPMWRASLEVLDFLPLAVVDYSGGMLITDWYSENGTSATSLKITLRFLSNEIRSDSLKVVVHQKKCSPGGNCTTKLLDSKINDELLTSIIRKAALLEKEQKKKITLH